jgi:glycosyltransferase involved in cell wall biosynthesis
MAKAGAVGRLAALTVTDRPRTVHTFHGHIFGGYFPSTVERGFAALERHLARHTDVLLAVSPQVRDELLDLGIGRPAQFQIMPVGLDLDPYLAINGSQGAFRSELGLDADTPLVGCVGRLVPIKDHLTLLRAIKRLPAAHLAIVGHGELAGHLRAETARLGLGTRVHFTGWRSDLPSVYSDLDAVALTSRNEGTPTAVIEALAAARPVVSTDVGGVRHVVDDGRTGFLVPAGDDQAVADRLAAVLADHSGARRLGTAGRADVAGRFSQQRLVDEVRELYRSLIGGP